MSAGRSDIGGATASTAGVISRRIGRPRPRAMVGALLVTTAGVITFGAHLSAGDDPTTTVLIARGEIPAGTQITDTATAARFFDARAMHLDPILAERTAPGTSIDELVGRFLTTSLHDGDPLLRTAVSDVEPPGVTLAFSVPRVDALDGSVNVGDRIDVLVTRAGSEDARTSYLLTDVEVRAVRSGDGRLGSAGAVSVTVVVPTPSDALALTHAARTAELALAHSSATQPEDRVRADATYDAATHDAATDGAGTDGR